jgi:DNA-binding transcriptional regulator YiaG
VFRELRELVKERGPQPVEAQGLRIVIAQAFVILQTEMARPRQFVAAPLPGWARRIRALRAGISLNQFDFGKRLKCSSMVISRWERGLQKPPADCLITMGKIAGPPAGWYFWKLAGIDPDDARRMLEET